MLFNIKLFILEQTGAIDILECEVVQEVWSGFGQVLRVKLEGAPFYKSVVVKNIILSNEINQPRGWNTDVSRQRKLISYKVEHAWYENYAGKCLENCRVPKFYGCLIDEANQILLLEDLNANGYPIRENHLNKKEAKLCLSWLANFHATFINQTPEDLWPIGSYWHLGTRKEEFQAMADGPIKDNASKIDDVLNTCKYQTIIHGDAKVANFCFSEDGTKVAALDFQYAGGGCGMKDIAYFLGSCLNESQCEIWEEELLDSYFISLKSAVNSKGVDIDFFELENEWRLLFPIAWADFSRFLLGWMPKHSKLNSYSDEIINRALTLIEM